MACHYPLRNMRQGQEDDSGVAVSISESEDNSAAALPEHKNPMLNSVVLQTLFKHTSINEMKTYRQVCKLWWEVSLPRWRRCAWVSLDDNNIKPCTGFLFVDSYLDMVNGTVSGDPFQFGKCPFKRFDLDGWQFDLSNDSDSPNRQVEFWKKCGPSITHLEIWNSHFLSVRDFEAILFRSVPNLVFLQLRHDNEFDAPEEEREVELKDEGVHFNANGLKELQLIGNKSLPVISWTRFLAQNPKIETLRIANYRYTYYEFFSGEEFDDIMNAMITLARERRISWKLKELDLILMGALRTAVFEKRHSELFRQLQLPLTTLRLHVGSELTGRDFKSILETCASTLRKLVVYRTDLRVDDEDINQCFPYGVQLDKLSELWLSGKLLCENLNFLPFTPNLASLILAWDIGTSLLAAGTHVSGRQTWKRMSAHLPKRARVGHVRPTNGTGITDTDFSQLKDIACPFLKEFIVSGRYETVCSADKVAALSKLMPNLKTLMLGLNNDGFRVACESWKQLEVLIIQPCQVNQFGLTGNVPLLEHRLPNLSDLTRLRYFGMGFKTRETPQMTLTEKSFLNAIFPLENLQDLTAVYNLKVKAVVREELRSKFPDSKIYEVGENIQEWPFDTIADYYDNDADSEDSSSEIDVDEDWEDD